MNQHYIPRTYLKNFVSPKEGQLVVYNKENKEIYYRPSRRIFSKPTFFTLHGVQEALRFHGEEPGKEDHDLCMEHELGKMETEVGRILKNLTKENCLTYIDQEKIATIVDWAALIFVVTNHVNRKEFLKLSADKRIGMLIDQYEIILPTFGKRNWGLAFAPKGKVLFSSDCPVSLLDPESLYNPVSLNNGEIFFPLSPKILLRGGLKKNFNFCLARNPLPDEIVCFANFSAYRQAAKLIVANEKRNLEDFLTWYRDKFYA